MVELNTMVFWNIYDDQAQNSCTTADGTLIPNHDYRLRVSVKNTGTEVHFDRLQLRIVGVPGKLLLYDPGFTNPRNRVHLEFENVPPKQWRNSTIYMRVMESISDEKLLTIGVYGLVRPEGHEWSGWMKWPSDRYKDY